MDRADKTTVDEVNTTDVVEEPMVDEVKTTDVVEEPMVDEVCLLYTSPSPRDS